MALCTNSTSLLDLAFAINAVYAVVLAQVSETRSKVADVVVAHFKAVEPSFAVAPEDRTYLEAWVSKAFKGLGLAMRARYVPIALSLGIMIMAAGTLYQTAVWGEKCKIGDGMLAWLTILALFVAPATYFAFGSFLAYLIRAVATRSFPSQEKTKASIDLYRLGLATRRVCDDAQVSIDAADRQMAEFAARDLREMASRLAHPVRTITDWGRNRWLDYRLRKL